MEKTKEETKALIIALEAHVINNRVLTECYRAYSMSNDSHKQANIHEAAADKLEKRIEAIRKHSA